MFRRCIMFALVNIKWFLFGSVQSIYMLNKIMYVYIYVLCALFYAYLIMQIFNQLISSDLYVIILRVTFVYTADS